MSKARNLSDFISDPTISSTEIADQAVTHPKLHGTMDLSSKTVTLPTLSTLNITGNVGIGETSPLGKLHVKTADSGATADASADELVIEGSGNTGISILSGASNAGSIYFGDSGTNWDGYIAYNQSSRSMTFGVAAGGGTVNIDSSGNVGIGTSSPARQLSIVDDGTNGQAIMEVIDSTNNNLAGIFLGRANNTNIGGMRYFHSTNHLALRSNDVDALIINSSGNVGIGTSSPSSILHTNNTADAPNGITIQNSSASGSADSYVQFKTSSADVIMGIDATGTDVFKISNSTALGTSDVLTIDSSGNLLVGKTTGSLAPNGAAFFTSGQSDYSSDAAYISKFNKKGADGTILEFRKDTTTVVGSVGVLNSNNLTISGTVADHGGLQFGTHCVIPMEANVDSNGTVDLGNSGSRFKDAYLSGGIYLGGTGSANKLDDYEEGTWTPVDNNGNAYNNGAIATYTKIGRIVYVNFDVNSTGSTGGGVISGLPFLASPSSVTGNWSVYGGYSTSNSDLWGHINQNSTSITMYVGSIGHVLNGRWIGAGFYYTEQ